MIKIVLGTNTYRKTIIADKTDVVKNILIANEIDYTTTTIHLDGIPLSTTELNSTLEDLNITDTAYIVGIVKCDNAR